MKKKSEMYINNIYIFLIFLYLYISIYYKNYENLIIAILQI